MHRKVTLLAGVLDSAGSYLSVTYGTGGATELLGIALAGWLAMPMAGAPWAFHQQKV